MYSRSQKSGSNPSPSLATRQVAFSSSSCCMVIGAYVPVLPLGIRGGRPPPPYPLLPDRASARRMATMTTTSVASPSVQGRGDPEGADIPQTLQLGAMILVWCLNIYFNIYNKLVLKAGSSRTPSPPSSLHLAPSSPSCGCLICIPGQGSPFNSMKRSFN